MFLRLNDFLRAEEAFFHSFFLLLWLKAEFFETKSLFARLNTWFFLFFFFLRLKLLFGGFVFPFPHPPAEKLHTLTHSCPAQNWG